MEKDTYTKKLDYFVEQIEYLEQVEQTVKERKNYLDLEYGEHAMNAFESVIKNAPGDTIFNLRGLFGENSEISKYLWDKSLTQNKKEELSDIKSILLDGMEEYMESSDFYLLVLNRIRKCKPNATGEEILLYLIQALYMMNKNKRNEEAEVNRLVRLNKNNK